jgi:hypothetical protein
MKLRWSFRAANDRASQSESQVLSLGPNKNPFTKVDGFLFVLFIINYSSFIIHSCRTDFLMNNEY